MNPNGLGERITVNLRAIGQETERPTFREAGNECGQVLSLQLARTYHHGIAVCMTGAICMRRQAGLSVTRQTLHLTPASAASRKDC